MSVFTDDKPDLMRRVLDYLGVSYHPGHTTQMVSCPGPAHMRGDRNPSASVHLGKGSFRCFACGLAGDGYDLLKELEGLSAREVNEILELGDVESRRKVRDKGWLF